MSSQESSTSEFVKDFEDSKKQKEPSDRWSPLPSHGLGDTSLLEVGTGTSVAAGAEPRLADLLCGAMLRNFKDSTMPWLPLGELSRLCTRPNVYRELEAKFGQSDAARYTDYTRVEARKIFAILVLTKELDKLERFVKCGYSDKDLPFIEEHVDGMLQAQLRPLAVNGHETCFREGEQSFIREFHRELREVHIPFISRINYYQVPEYQLHPRTIMPWTFYQPIEKKSRYFDVYKVKIHPSHHTFDGHEAFALKVFRSGDQEDFERELYALKTKTPGPHVNEVLATIKRGDELSLLFPWADKGNLGDLMNKEPSELISGPNASEVLTRWLAAECAGIAKGLHWMHNAEPKVRNGDNSDMEEWMDNYGIHGDIKPENILRFRGDEDLGKLKLSDFGMTKFHTGWRSRRLGKGPQSATYVSPEQMLGGPEISRRSDVWALGCVFSMLLTWAIRGPGEVEEYTTARFAEKSPGQRMTFPRNTFFGKEYTQDGRPVVPERFFLKGAVIDCIEKNKEAILGPDGEPNYLTEFLDFIRDEMLEINADKRATSDRVCQFLNEKMQEHDRAGYSTTLPTSQGS